MITNKISETFHFFKNCIPVKGASRGIIYDLQREDFDYIPLSLIEMLENYDGKTIADIINEYGSENKNTIIEYFNFLYEKEYIFFSDLPKEQFPSYNESFERPYNISNLILDISNETYKTIDSIYDQIEILGCEAILFRFFDINITSEHLLNLLEKFNDSSVRTIEIIIPANFNVDLEAVTHEYGKISKIIIYSSAKKSLKVLTTHVLVVELEDALTESSKNIIDLRNFIICMKLFMESKNYNNFYYKKVYIDGIGQIRNAPELSTSFGNIQDIQLAEILINKDFKMFWDVKKDDIRSCKDCEYRYMCIDSRKLTYNNTEKIWEAEGTCPYNPYTNEWN